MPRTPRTAALGAVVLVLLSACGRSPDDETVDTAASASTVSRPATTTGGGTGTGPDAAGDTVPGTTEAPAPTTTLEKPDVSLPAELPTELVITDIEEGTGTPAASGDRVVVRYVGVRSEDGTEFDNNFEGGDPFSVTLGAGGVIEGWDQGLVGIKQGGRRQLDIPGDLAYGEAGAGEIIQPGDALSFVIDAVAVIPAGDPADAPELTIPPAENVAELEIEDQVVGEGEELGAGQTAVVQLIAARADTGETLLSTWESGAPESIPYVEEQMLPGLFEGLSGMRVGGRRIVTIPYESSFGREGNQQLGLPPEVDLVVIIDLVAAY
jgi:peptidylprolyl isomerase